MAANDLPSDEPLLSSQVSQRSGKQPKRVEATTNIKESSLDLQERRLLIFATTGLSILGVIAFLISGQVAVVVAMNAPLLAVIGRGMFSR